MEGFFEMVIFAPWGIRDIEILILLQVKILINDVENFYIVDTFPSDCDIYMYIKSNN